jgi:glycosyltransferase involved in cell wall biosynthesis
MTRLKIIAIGFNTYGTGLTRVMHDIMGPLADRHEIHYLGIGYSGETVHDRGLTMHPTNPNGGDVFAAFQAKEMIEEIDPDIVFILHDIWMFDYYARILGPYRDRLKIVCYIPLDGKIVNEADAAALEHFDRVVVYTRFAQKEFQDAFDRLRKKQGGEFPPVDVLPHGIDVTHFYPLPELVVAGFASSGRAEAKEKVFDDFEGREDSFIVLNASRPDRRKRVDLTIKGFALFAADKPKNVKLCLHHAIMDQPSEKQVTSLVEELGIVDRVYLNPLCGGIVDDARLNLLYNACDVGINTSMGEGWGLVCFEHGGTGAAQIVPAHSACADLWHGRAEFMEPVRRYIPDFTVLEMGEVSPEGVAAAMNNLYYDPDRRVKLAQAAVETAQRPEYSWNQIAKRFSKLFLELTN